MKIIKITSLSLSLLVISIITTFAPTSVFAADYRIHGSAGCQTYYGAQDQYLDNFYFGAYNNHTESVWVVCPMSHDYESPAPIGYLDFYVVQGSGSSVCYGARVSNDGSTEELIGPTTVSTSGLYWFYLDSVPVSEFHSVNILCNLSPGAYITNTYVNGV